MTNTPHFYYGHGEEIDPTTAAQLEHFTTGFKLELKAVDEGIGAYEFWGAPGFDSRPALEVTSPDYPIYVSIPPCDFTEAWNKVEEICEYLRVREEDSADFGGRCITGMFEIQLEACLLEVDPSTKKIIGLSMNFCWSEI